jgi:phosphoglycerate dehydrogenase-like enzyme
VLFAERDKMFHLIGEALAPSAEGPKFLAEFFLTESADPVALMRDWSSRRNVPKGIQVSFAESADELDRKLPDARVLVIENTPIGTERIERSKALRLIQGFGRQMPFIDRDACAASGIAVRALDRHSNRLVAEHVVLLMLALARGFEQSREALRAPSRLPPSSWAFNWPACKGVVGLTGRVVGLVGLGQVGSLVAEYLRPFGVQILYTKRSRDRRLEETLRLEFATLQELMERSDFVSLHAPEDASTRHLINEPLLKHAKPGQFLINTARGSLIEGTALVEALRGGPLGGAALDVFAAEPLDPAHPLNALPNVILTPHVAAGTRDAPWLDRELGPIVDSIVSAL